VKVPSSPGESVVGLLGAVAQDEPVPGEFIGDGADSGTHGWIIGGQEPDEGNKEEGGIEVCRAVGLDEYAAVVDTVATDVLMDLLGDGVPLPGIFSLAMQAGQSGAPVQGDPVQGDPAHEL
jgi:hypothetical protein